MAPPRIPATRADNPLVYFDVQIGDSIAGRLIIELRADVVPMTAENFRRLCTGETKSTLTGKRRHYTRCPIHRVVKHKFCQSGDYVNRDGSGGESAFDLSRTDPEAETELAQARGKNGTSTFEDENFILRHTGAGVLSMANAGPDTNASQFYLHFAAHPEFDGKHVVFGCLADAASFVVLDKIQAVATERGDPKTAVQIRRCGQLTE